VHVRPIVQVNHEVTRFVVPAGAIEAAPSPDQQVAGKVLNEVARTQTAAPGHAPAFPAVNREVEPASNESVAEEREVICGQPHSG
jgi:hypothetical protein